MAEVREDMHLGLINPQPGYAMGMEAKFRIAEVLDIDINCVSKFKNIAAF
jgi:hypothetical protein